MVESKRQFVVGSHKRESGSNQPLGVKSTTECPVVVAAMPVPNTDAIKSAESPKNSTTHAHLFQALSQEDIARPLFYFVTSFTFLTI